jgi:hypothetical protein
LLCVPSRTAVCSASPTCSTTRCPLALCPVP